MKLSKRESIAVPRRLVADPSFKSSDVRVFAVLMDICSSAKEIEESLDSIAERTGLSTRTVCTVLDRLEARGFIVRDSRRGPYSGLIRLNSSVEQFSA